MYYSYREIVDAKVYDSEGLYYGYVCGFNLVNKPELKICIEYNIGDRIPDINSLKKKLRDKGFEIPEDITLEDLVLTARNEKIEIPYIEVEKRVDFVKGFIGLNEVSIIDTVYRKTSDNDWRLSIILLNKPREAVYRGYPLPYSNPYLEQIEKTIGKLVVNLNEGIIGYVEDIVFAPNDIGLRLNTCHYRRGSINWSNFLTLIKTRGYQEHYNMLVKEIGDRDKLDISYYGYIIHTLRKIKAPAESFNLLNNTLEFEEVIIEKYRDISWNNVLKTGDIIITK
uniref:PRC-barrel domain-containing protein n=1 Tax=Staphylothermus marinus TaxID=2280 RepID=A0A7C4HBK5_STAMA